MKPLSRLKSWFMVLSLFFAISCSKPNSSPLEPGDNILAFGDSLTFGIGATKGGDYPSQLAKLTGLRVDNYGISGETTAQGLKRFASVLAETQPELVILLEGGNDILRNQKLSQAKANLAAMITLAQQAQVQVVLIAVPNKGLFLSDASLYQELAEEYSLVFIEDIISDLLKQPKYKSDAIHLNTLGYGELAKKIHETLLEASLISH